eukprot:433707-Rhodomonas_salina.1
MAVRNLEAPHAKSGPERVRARATREDRLFRAGIALSWPCDATSKTLNPKPEAQCANPQRRERNTHLEARQEDASAVLRVLQVLQRAAGPGQRHRGPLRHAARAQHRARLVGHLQLQVRDLALGLALHQPVHRQVRMPTIRRFPTLSHRRRSDRLAACVHCDLEAFVQPHILQIGSFRLVPRLEQEDVARDGTCGVQGCVVGPVHMLPAAVRAGRVVLRSGPEDERAAPDAADVVVLGPHQLEPRPALHLAVAHARQPLDLEVAVGPDALEHCRLVGAVLDLEQHRVVGAEERVVAWRAAACVSDTTPNQFAAQNQLCGVRVAVRRAGETEKDAVDVL